MKNRLQNKLITKGSICWKMRKVAAQISDLFEGEIWQTHKTKSEYITILSFSSNAYQPDELLFSCLLLNSRQNKLMCG